MMSYKIFNLLKIVTFDMSKLHNVINGDCIKVMDSMPAKSVQLVFADPPFNLNKSYNTYKDNMPFKEYVEWTKDWIKSAMRILKSDGTIMVYNIPKLLTHTACILNDHAEFKHWIAWNSGGKPLGKTLQPAHYGILYYTKSKKSKFYDVRAPHKTCRKCNVYEKDYGGKEHLRHPFGYQVSDVWNDIHRIRHNCRRIEGHPCQLPVHLLERIILMTTDPGDMVVDPFCGGGSGVIASKRLGRKCLGIDIDEYYANSSRNRMNTEEPVMHGNAYVSKYLNKIVSMRDCDITEDMLIEHTCQANL